MRTHLRQIAAIGLVAIVSLGLSACDEKKEGSNEGPHQKVDIDQVPAPVKATILAESRGGEVQDVEKFEQQGKTIYDAHIKRNGLKNELRVAEDGKVLPAESKKDDDD